MNITRIDHAGIDADMLIWLVVVGFTLISQWARAAKQKPRSGQHPPVARTPMPPRRAAQSPLPKSEVQQELENFLRSLTGAPPVMESAPPPPPPVVRPHIKEEPAPPPREFIHKRVVAQSAPPPLPKAPPMRIERKPVPVAPIDSEFAPGPSGYRKSHPLAATAVDPYATGNLTTGEARLLSLRNHLGTDLLDRAALAKAIILRELLDPPLALRQPRQAGL